METIIIRFDYKYQFNYEYDFLAFELVIFDCDFSDNHSKEEDGHGNWPETIWRTPVTNLVVIKSRTRSRSRILVVKTKGL